MTGWRLDEGAHAGPEHLDPAYVGDYDAKTQLDLEAALELLRRHGLDGARRFADEAADRARGRLDELDADTSVLRDIVDGLAVRTA